MKYLSSKLSITLLFLSIACLSSAQNGKPAASRTETKFPEASAFEKSKLTYKIINAPNKTFGYDIFSDGKLLIHQPSVPGMSGNEGFKTQQSTEKVAQLVITKIKNGQMPPTVTVEEMQNLKAIK